MIMELFAFIGVAFVTVFVLMVIKIIVFGPDEDNE